MSIDGQRMRFSKNQVFLINSQGKRKLEILRQAHRVGNYVAPVWVMVLYIMLIGNHLRICQNAVLKTLQETALNKLKEKPQMFKTKVHCELLYNPFLLKCQKSDWERYTYDRFEIQTHFRFTAYSYRTEMQASPTEFSTIVDYKRILSIKTRVTLTQRRVTLTHHTDGVIY